MPAGFDCRQRTRIVFGVGVAERVGALTQELGVERALLVTDPGLARAGHAERVRESLETAGLAVSVHADVRENPTVVDVDACVTAARAARADALVGLGGGSSIDTARGAAFLLAGGGRMADYEGYGKVQRPMLPLVAVPTTAGTGSECQSFALIADDANHRKMACGDPKAAARLAILDPALTATQPRHVTVNTGLDALVHAIETAVTTRRNPLSLIYSHEAFLRVHANLPRALEHPTDLEARAHMQLGAALAGIAIETSMLGAAHAAANPLTARYGVVHGQAVAVMLPAVMRYNAALPEAQRAYADLGARAGLSTAGAPPEMAAAALHERVEELLRFTRVPRSLAEHGVPRDDVRALAIAAQTSWTGRFNPRPIDREGFETLYRDAFG